MRFFGSRGELVSVKDCQNTGHFQNQLEKNTRIMPYNARKALACWSTGRVDVEEGVHISQLCNKTFSREALSVGYYEERIE